jgi:hypothetical protein
MDLLSNFNNPVKLEELYHEDSRAFKEEFAKIYPALENSQLASFWHARLNFEFPAASKDRTIELGIVILLSFFAGLAAKLPGIYQWDQEHFFQRNIGFIVFPALSFYFLWKKESAWSRFIIAFVIFLASFIFINLMPQGDLSDTMILSCIHLPVLLWAVLGYSYGAVSGNSKRLEFMRYNGELLIMTGLIIIAGFLLSAITVGLFKVIGLQIGEFYFLNIGVFGLAASPIVATYITQANPHLVNKVSPVIARIFSPLVLIMLVSFLVATFFAGKDPYNDRDFLIVFNALLIGVMAIILFSLAETFRNDDNRLARYILLALSVVTILVNGIALSAIVFRISEWGMTPNRFAVMGGNILILTNLCMVAYQLFRSVSKRPGQLNSDTGAVENAIAKFLPVYIAWAIVVSFIFPFVFSFK